MRITSEDLRESKIFMYFITVIRYASFFYDLTQKEVMFMMSLHCKKRFSREGFFTSGRTLSWDADRFNKLMKRGFIEVYRHRHGDKTIYKVSRKGNEMVNKIYRILLGEEEIKINHKNPVRKADTYTKKMLLSSIADMKKDYNQETKGYY